MKKNVLIMVIMIMIFSTLSVNALDMTGKSGLGIMGPQKVSIHNWYNDNFSYGIMFGYSEGILIPIEANYVFEKVNDGRLRFSFTGGYTYTSTDKAFKTDIFPQSWYGIGMEYIFNKFSLRTFYGKLNIKELEWDDEVNTYSETGPKIELIYYW